MPTANPIDDREKYPNELVLTKDGYRGVRYWRAQAASLEDAHAADNLPRIGDPWSASLATVIVTSIDPREERKGGGWWVYAVRYEQNFGQLPETSGVGVVTRIVPSSTTQQVLYDITGTRKLTKDNRGVAKIVTKTLFEVTRYFDNLPDLTPYRNITDEPKVNDAAVTLPNYFNSGQSVEIPAGELLYVKFTPDVEGQRFVVRSELHWARRWKHEKIGENPDGTPSGSGELLDIYETGSFAGLI